MQETSLAWGKDLGLVAINSSAEVRYDNGFKNSIVKNQMENGIAHIGSWSEWLQWCSRRSKTLEKCTRRTSASKSGWKFGYDYSAGMNPDGNCNRFKW